MIEALNYVRVTGDRERPRLVGVQSRHEIAGLGALLCQHAGPVEYKRCFENATMLAARVPGVSYVEGEVWQPRLQMPVDHAWNSINGHFFDLTWEMYQGLQPEHQYYAIIEGSIVGLVAEGFDPSRTRCLLHQLINKRLN